MTNNPKGLNDALKQGVNVSYAVKYLPCDDDQCMICLMGKGHGPYWYAQYELDGEAKNVFLGREFRPLDLARVILKNYQEQKERKKAGHASAESCRCDGHDSSSRSSSTKTASAQGSHTQGFSATSANAKSAGTKRANPTSASPTSAGSTSSGFNDNRIDEVGRVGAAKASSAKMGSFAKPRTLGPDLPSRADFERDLRLLKGSAMTGNLKQVYRKLIKKYHPDQFQGNPVMNHWMSEINGQYNRLASGR